MKFKMLYPAYLSIAAGVVLCSVSNVCADDQASGFAFPGQKKAKTSEESQQDAMSNQPYPMYGQQGQGGQQGPGQGGQQGPPPAEQVASMLIEKFSSDKKSLTQAELIKALEFLHANRGRRGQGGSQGQGGQGGMMGPGRQGGPGQQGGQQFGPPPPPPLQQGQSGQQGGPNGQGGQGQRGQQGEQD